MITPPTCRIRGTGRCNIYLPSSSKRGARTSRRHMRSSHAGTRSPVRSRETDEGGHSPASSVIFPTGFQLTSKAGGWKHGSDMIRGCDTSISWRPFPIARQSKPLAMRRNMPTPCKSAQTGRGRVSTSTHGERRDVETRISGPSVSHCGNDRGFKTLPEPVHR